MSDQINVFGKANFRNKDVKFGIKTDDRRRHMYLLGKTGMGKSVVLENMIIQDILAGNGLAVVDPHGDLVEKVIKFVPKSRINDVVYINPADFNFPVAFNVLENVSEEYRHLVASGLLGVFKKIWADSWGPRL
jgi:DNA helicase HerA-like ATPase